MSLKISQISVLKRFLLLSFGRLNIMFINFLSQQVLHINHVWVEQDFTLEICSHEVLILYMQHYL